MVRYPFACTQCSLGSIKADNSNVQFGLKAIPLQIKVLLAGSYFYVVTDLDSNMSMYVYR